jgi:hypothetical protein
MALQKKDFLIEKMKKDFLKEKEDDAIEIRRLNNIITTNNMNLVDKI